MRIFLLYLIALLPCSPLKRFFYRLCFGYNIGAGSKIGFALLDAKSVNIGPNCRICNFAAFRRLNHLELGEGTLVGPFNLMTTSVEQDHYQYDFTTGKGVFLSRSHRFDMSQNISIGDESQVGGVFGHFWTHGAWREHGEIRIGKKCFISDGVYILPGVTLRDNTLVSVGSVVSPKDYPPDCMLMGNPARVIQKDYIWWDDKNSASTKITE